MARKPSGRCTGARGEAEMAEKNTDELLLKKQRLPRPALFVFLFLVGAIAFSGYFYYRNQRKDVFNEQISQLKTIADLKASQIVNWLAERIANDRLITQDPDRVATLSAFFRDRSNAARRESVQYWLSSLQKVYHYENVLLLDRQGEVVLAANPQHAQVGSEGLKAIETARRLRDVVLTNLHDNPQVPHIHLDLVAPLISGEELSGFVILRIDPGDFLFPMIQSWPTPSPSAETLLVRREGDNVLFLNELRHRKDTALKLRLPLRNLELPAAQAILGRSGAFSGRDYRGVDVWSVVRPVEGTLWFIVAKVDSDELEQPMRRSALAVFLVALFLILAAAAIILFLWQRQNSRLRLSQFAALRESEDKFKYVFDNSMVGKSITLPERRDQRQQGLLRDAGVFGGGIAVTKMAGIDPSRRCRNDSGMLDQVISGKTELGTLREKISAQKRRHRLGRCQHFAAPGRAGQAPLFHDLGPRHHRAQASGKSVAEKREQASRRARRDPISDRHGRSARRHNLLLEPQRPRPVRAYGAHLGSVVRDRLPRPRLQV